MYLNTGSVSSLANYMALQEYSFVTLGQRVLNKPLRMRLHYGHPDIFDKLFFMQVICLFSVEASGICIINESVSV